MENTTKALVIAACVLVAVLIISLGMSIYSKSSSSEASADSISDVEAMARNKQYQMYEGNRSGSEVKALLQKAADNNQTLYKSQDTIKTCVCIRSKDERILSEFSNNAEMKSALNETRSYGVRYPDNITQISNCISKFARYKIWFTYNEYGYIWEINIGSVDENN